MRSYIIRYGLLYSVAMVGAFILTYLLLGTSPDNYSKSELIGYSVMLICSLAIIMGIKDYKDNHNQGRLTFYQGLTVGTGISAIAATSFGIYNYIYLTWLDPDFTKNYMLYSEQQIMNSGASAEVIEQQLAELASYSHLMDSMLFQVSVMFITVFLIGMLFTLVGAAAMRHHPTIEES